MAVKITGRNLSSGFVWAHNYPAVCVPFGKTGYPSELVSVFTK